jgi:hypothetical protein
MSFPITCTACHTKLRVSKDPAGRKWKCPVCAHKFVVPEMLPEVSSSQLPSAHQPPPLPPVASAGKKTLLQPALPPEEPAGAYTPSRGATIGVTVICPQCEGELLFDEDPSGSACRCPLCQHRFDIPANLPELVPEDEPDDLEAPDEEDEASSRPRKKKRRRRRRGSPAADDLESRLRNGFAMLGCTWRVLVTDKHLLLIQVLTALLLLVVAAGFLVPTVLLVDWEAYNRQVAMNGGEKPVWVYVWGFALGFALHFVGTFGQVALVSCAMLRFKSRESTFGAGLRGAFARIPQILAWALVSASFGLFLKLVENIHKKIGHWVARLLGEAWGTLTYFVVPLMVDKKVGPFKAIGQSIKLLRQTWGEAVSTHVGLRLILKILWVPVGALFVLGGYLYFKTFSPLVFLPGVIAAFLHLMIGATLDNILSAALYRYAAKGQVPEAFDPDLMAAAFTSKSSRAAERLAFEAEMARWRVR